MFSPFTNCLFSCCRQQVVLASATQSQPIRRTQHNQSFVGHMVFACVVFCCCNPLFGLIAFILAGALNHVYLLKCVLLLPPPAPLNRSLRTTATATATATSPV